MTSTTSDLLELSNDTILTTLREIIADAPAGYVNPKFYNDTVGTNTCFYAIYDTDHKPVKPSCIIGHLVHRLGISLERIADNENMPASTVMARFFTFEDTAILNELDRLQYDQDRGESWQSAFAVFELQVACIA